MECEVSNSVTSVDKTELPYVTGITVTGCLGCLLVAIVSIFVTVSAGFSWARGLLSVFPTVLVIGWILMFIFWIVTLSDNSPSLKDGLFSFGVIGAFFILLIVTKVIIVNPIEERKTESTTVTSFEVTRNKDGNMFVIPNLEIVVSKTDDGFVTVNPYDDFWISEKAIEIGSENVFAFDIVSYTDEDFSIYNKRLTVTYDVAQQLGLVSKVSVSVGE